MLSTLLTQPPHVNAALGQMCFLRSEVSCISALQFWSKSNLELSFFILKHVAKLNVLWIKENFGNLVLVCFL